MRYLFILLIVIHWSVGYAQINLVQNPSFEQYWRCPYNFDQIKFANYWSPIDTIDHIAVGDSFGSPNCTPEYCNECSTNPTVSVPLSFSYYHYPHTGKGMAQVVMYNSDTNSAFSNGYLRDYLQGQLKTHLISSKEYCVTFYTTLEQNSAYAIDHIGAYFDDATIDTTQNCGLPQTNHIPQIVSSSIINDTLNWVKIQGSFIANGAEKYITIGNFYDNTHTDTIRVYFPLAVNRGNTFLTFYLIDDVSVIAIDAVADAGRDTFTSPTGDSVFIGTNDGYLPCKWYTITGALIDSNIAGFKVKPAVTTKYVMELDVCGVLSRDTVTVFVAPLSIINYQLLMINVRVYPNPAINNLIVEGASGCKFAIYNLIGQEMFHSLINSDKETLNIENLEKGVYFVHIVDNVTGYSVVKQVLKE